MKTNILKELADSLNNTARILVSLAEMSEAAAKENEQDFVEIPTEETNTISLEQVRAVLAEKSRMGMTTAVKNLLSEYGVDKLSEVEPRFYREIIEKAEELNNAT